MSAVTSGVSHHKLAVLAYAAMAAVTAVVGALFAAFEHLAVMTGFYWAIITVTTIGYGDVIPHNSPGRLMAVILAVTGIPLYSLTVALFTSWLMSGHIRRAKDEIKQQVTDAAKDPT